MTCSLGRWSARVCGCPLRASWSNQWLHQRRARRLAVGLGALALGGAITGAAVVVVVYNIPGTTSGEPIGSGVFTTNTGIANFDLGPALANATVVVIDLGVH